MTWSKEGGSWAHPACLRLVYRWGHNHKQGKNSQRLETLLCDASLINTWRGIKFRAWTTSRFTLSISSLALRLVIVNLLFLQLPEVFSFLTHPNKWLQPDTGRLWGRGINIMCAMQQQEITKNYFTVQDMHLKYQLGIALHEVNSTVISASPLCRAESLNKCAQPKLCNHLKTLFQVIQ